MSKDTHRCWELGAGSYGLFSSVGSKLTACDEPSAFYIS